MNGAKNLGYEYSLPITAQENGANPLRYMEYVYEKMPGNEGKFHDDAFLETMMPWSPEYRAYEEKCKEEILAFLGGSSLPEPDWWAGLKSRSPKAVTKGESGNMA